MIPILTITAVLFLMVLALVAMAVHKIQTNGSSIPADVLQECSVERYRPMLRLLNDADCDFIIRGFPEHAREMRRRVRAERRSLFRIYLRDLAGDHARIVKAIRHIIVESDIDRPELAMALYRCQFVFAFAIVSIEFKLLLHAIGLGTVNVQDLLAVVEGLQLQFQDMMFVRAVGNR